ncbi:heavy metal-binding domain-containing protein, partial [Roseomonas sp. USHLN139]|uniref:heavy metal-binding domain-containing protein n=1 Tax=Roseomonas sp. USHLN139 TaxID=3081298 RepID=UPI003B02375C
MDERRHDHHHHHGHHHGHDTPAAAQPAENNAPKVRDPVCGMEVDPVRTPHHAHHDGAAFHFCSAGCKSKFAADPGKYLKAERAAPPTAADKAATYTCPMHPEVRQQGPGNCPICGMALEPLEVTAEAAPNAELADMTRRFWIGLVLTLPILVLEMGAHIPGLAIHHLVPPRVSVWLQFLLG